MNTEPVPPPPVPTGPATPRRARRISISPVWLIPIIAGLIAAWLGARSLSEQGPSVTITFKTASGLEAGKTRIRHKDVDLGVVEDITLADDLSHVRVAARMTAAAGRHLTEGSRFWVVRPRFSAAGVSGLQTLVSGAHIELDPGPGASARQFTGLEDPPIIRSDVPGRRFVVLAERLGAIGPGSPVFFRDLRVGQVTGYDPGGYDDPARVHIFVNDPYAEFVHEGSRFWNASGIALRTGGTGVEVEFESLLALVAGGIAFDTPPGARVTSRAEAGREFRLFANRASTDALTITRRVPFRLVFEGSVRGLAVGAPVEVLGLPVGQVTDVRLEINLNDARVRAPVMIEIEPERIAIRDGQTVSDPNRTIEQMVERGLRAQLRPGNLLTGQLVVAFDTFPNAAPASVTNVNGVAELPTIPSELEGIVRSVNQVLEQLAALPVEEIGRNLNEAVKGLRDATAGPAMKDAIGALSRTMAATESLVRKADQGLGPTLQKLPATLATLQTALNQTAGVLRSVEEGYGGNSQLRRDVGRLVAQLNDSARSIRLLAEFLEQHPEGLVRGKSSQALR